MTLKLCGPKSDMRPSALNGIGLFRERVRAAQTRPFFVACLALPVFLCSLSGWVIIACNGCFFNTDSAVASLRGKRASSGSLLSDLSLIWNWSGLSVVADICAWADCSHTPFASPAPPICYTPPPPFSFFSTTWSLAPMFPVCLCTASDNSLSGTSGQC